MNSNLVGSASNIVGSAPNIVGSTPNPTGSTPNPTGSADDLVGSADDMNWNQFQLSDVIFPSDDSTDSMRGFRNMDPRDMKQQGWSIPPGLTPTAVEESSSEESLTSEESSTPTSEVPTSISTSPLLRRASEPIKPTQVVRVQNDLVHSDP